MASNFHSHATPQTADEGNPAGPGTSAAGLVPEHVPEHAQAATPQSGQDGPEVPEDIPQEQAEDVLGDNVAIVPNLAHTPPPAPDPVPNPHPANDANVEVSPLFKGYLGRVDGVQFNDENQAE